MFGLQEQMCLQGRWHELAFFVYNHGEYFVADEVQEGRVRKLHNSPQRILILVSIKFTVKSLWDVRNGMLPQIQISAAAGTICELKLVLHLEYHGHGSSPTMGVGSINNWKRKRACGSHSGAEEEGRISVIMTHDLMQKEQFTTY
ncbi:hypothetical protein A2U01_0019669, partial [Trifolium medium]|nr:hypothetical protein [Trifolium medium]